MTYHCYGASSREVRLCVDIWGMTHSFPRLSFLLVLTLWSASFDCARADESVPQLWNPVNTWVFAVSLAQFQENRLHAFDPAERIDGDFETLFERRGVPRGQIVFLKDEQGTTNHIRAAFEQLMRRTHRDDFLFFYFGSHAGYDPKKDEYTFSTYDGSRFPTIRKTLVEVVLAV
jgi:hypothetical protein